MPDPTVVVLPQFDFAGRPVALVVAKRTWEWDDDRVLRPAAEPDPVRFADEPSDPEDPASPVRFEADTALVKERTDVLVVGTAWAPGGKPAPSFPIEVVVAGRSHVLNVLGPRRAAWRGSSRAAREGSGNLPVFTDPAPVDRVPLDFTRAYGGVARYRVPSGDVVEVPCPVNPAGRGFCVQNSPEGVDGLDLPQVEDPAAPLTPQSLVRNLADPPEALPQAVGFGVFGKAWYPRAAFMGVMPHEAQRVREQVRAQAATLDPAKHADAIAMLQEWEPPIMAPRFLVAGCSLMSWPELAGNEAVVLRNLTPDGYVAFDLPGIVPAVTLERPVAGPIAVDLRLDTVVMVPQDRRLMLTFRGRVALDSVEQLDAVTGWPVSTTDLPVAEARRRIGGSGSA